MEQFHFVRNWSNMHSCYKHKAGRKARERAMSLGYIISTCTKCHMVKALVATLKLSSPETCNETEDTWLKIRTGRHCGCVERGNGSILDINEYPLEHD
jgi:hypothetical protein